MGWLRGSAPMERHQEKRQYTEQYKNATWKGLWNVKNNEVSQGDKNVWRNITTSNCHNQHDSQQHLIVTNDFVAGYTRW